MECKDNYSHLPYRNFQRLSRYAYGYKHYDAFELKFNLTFITRYVINCIDFYLIYLFLFSLFILRILSRLVSSVYETLLLTSVIDDPDNHPATLEKGFFVTSAVKIHEDTNSRSGSAVGIFRHWILRTKSKLYLKRPLRQQ